EVVLEKDPRLVQWLEGIPMLGSLGRASRVQVLRTTVDYTELEVSLREGKNRQIRRMCRATDFRLIHLHRKRIGSVDLAGIAPGHHRLLLAEEIAALYEGVGGSEAVRKKQVRALELSAQRSRLAGAPHHRLEEWLAAHPL